MHKYKCHFLHTKKQVKSPLGLIHVLHDSIIIQDTPVGAQEADATLLTVCIHSSQHRQTHSRKSTSCQCDDPDAQLDSLRSGFQNHHDWLQHLGHTLCPIYTTWRAKAMSRLGPIVFPLHFLYSSASQ